MIDKVSLVDADSTSVGLSAFMEPVIDERGVEMIGFFAVLETEVADRGGVIAVAKCKLEGLFRTQARRRKRAVKVVGLDRRRNMKEASRLQNNDVESSEKECWMFLCD